jgi:hypothetical protein
MSHSDVHEKRHVSVYKHAMNISHYISLPAPKHKAMGHAGSVGEAIVDITDAVVKGVIGTFNNDDQVSTPSSPNFQDHG